MQITDVKVRHTFDGDSNMKAVVSVTFDDVLVVHDIKVIESKGKEFVAMPSTKMKDGTYRDVAHPVSSDLRKVLSETVLAAYHEALSAAAPESV